MPARAASHGPMLADARISSRSTEIASALVPQSALPSAMCSMSSFTRLKASVIVEDGATAVWLALRRPPPDTLRLSSTTAPCSTLIALTVPRKTGAYSTTPWRLRIRLAAIAAFLIPRPI